MHHKDEIYFCSAIHTKQGNTLCEQDVEFLTVKPGGTINVGPCHHGMARPQVADGGTASDMEGSCE
jgi:hypothetical protein